MKYGAVFPQLEITADGGQVREYIRSVEVMGYDYLLIYDHVLGANPDRLGGWGGGYTYKDQFHEVMTLLAYAAAITERLQFFTGILVLPQRGTALAAKQAAEIDVLSGGRMNVGVGVGWNRVELEGAGFTFGNRGRRVDEQVDVMRLLWTQELVRFEGKYHKLDDVGINPLPVQRPIPIWFGGAADPMLRRMARVGAGWLINRMPIERAQELLRTLTNYMVEEGRSMDDFGLDVRLNVSINGPDTWDAELQSWRNLGVTQVCVNTMGAGYSSLEEHLQVLRQFIEQYK